MPFFEEIAQWFMNIFGWFASFGDAISMIEAGWEGIAEWFTNFGISISNMFN